MARPPAMLTASDLSNYVVCPEAWRLKQESSPAKRDSERGKESNRLRLEWTQKQDLSAQLRWYAKISYLLLLLLVVVVFILDFKGFSTVFPTVSGEIPLEIYFLLVILGLIIFLWDLFDRRSKSLQELVGLESAETVAVRDGQYIPSKSYSSLSLGLSGRPDAIVKEEDGVLVPTSIYPLSQKVRDRHVISLLVHLRLIEEIEGVTPPYGLLIMGKKGRSARVLNTPEKQKWLDSLIEEMRSVIDGVPAQPAPVWGKCKNCDVRELCKHSAYKPPS